MAEREIVRNMIAAPGQAQDDRDSPALHPRSAPLHTLDAARLLVQARTIAERIAFDDGDEHSNLNWLPFYSKLDVDGARTLLARTDGLVTPHLALAAAFAQLFDTHPRRLANTFAERHHDVQLRDVLGFQRRAAVPDRAHLLVELKKGVTKAVALTTDSVLLGGKDKKTGVEQHYRPVRESLVGSAQVASLRAVHRDADGRVTAAPKADSADGLGAPLAAPQAAWAAFGPAPSTAWPAAAIGFAVASPLLAMAEGTRTVELTVALDDALSSVLMTRLASMFEAVYTTPKGWSDPQPTVARAQGSNSLVLTVNLPADAPVCSAADPTIHGAAYAASAPMMQFRLREGASMAGLDALTVSSAMLVVDVEGLNSSLALENDVGALDPKRPFQPFGSQPVVGSRFVIRCEEALSKPLTELTVYLTWQAAPASLDAWYANYTRRTSLANGVSATLAFIDGRGHTTQRSIDVMARGADGATVLAPSLTNTPPGSRPGMLRVQLSEDFLHADYRRESVYNALTSAEIVLNEPYTPTVQSIRLDYRAQTAVQLTPAETAAVDSARYAAAPLQWFHIGPFGARREHPFLRRQPFLQSARVPLIPEQQHEGELLIGLAHAAAGDAVHLLVQVAEGTADPELAPPALSWSVLCANHWRSCGAEEIALDSTRGFLQSGLVSLALPRETTTDNSWLPSGLVWVRVTAESNVRATCALLALAAGAIEVRFEDRGNDPSHAATPLPAGSITKLQKPLAQIKAIRQPFDSFCGALAETDSALRRRAAERLRHRQRALAPWDIERLVLDAFPSLSRVKCIPHAKPGNWLAPGHTTVVVVPRLHDGSTGVDLLRPRVDLGTLEAIEEFLRMRGPMDTGLVVKNPSFESIRLDFKLKLKAGEAFNPRRQRLNDLLVSALTPWASDEAQPLRFGGSVFRSVLLALVESQDYVDFVTDFRLQQLDDGGAPGPDAVEVAASRPDAILVSAPVHLIAEVA